jgi:hypothetical protein
MPDRSPLRNDRRNCRREALALLKILLHVFIAFRRVQMADFSARSPTLRYNERTKHFAGVLTAAGNALLIAAFAKVWVEVSFDLNSLTWLIMAALLLWLSSNMLKLLDAEENDG